MTDKDQAPAELRETQQAQIDAIKAQCWDGPGLGAQFDHDKFGRMVWGAALAAIDAPPVLPPGVPSLADLRQRFAGIPDHSGKGAVVPAPAEGEGCAHEAQCLIHGCNTNPDGAPCSRVAKAASVDPDPQPKGMPDGYKLLEDGKTMIPEDWTPLRLEWEPGYPEDVACGPARAMERLKKWLDAYFLLIQQRMTPAPAPAHGPVLMDQGERAAIFLEEIGFEPGDLQSVNESDLHRIAMRIEARALAKNLQARDELT